MADRFVKQARDWLKSLTDQTPLTAPLADLLRTVSAQARAEALKEAAGVVAEEAVAAEMATSRADTDLSRASSYSWLCAAIRIRREIEALAAEPAAAPATSPSAPAPSSAGEVESERSCGNCGYEAAECDFKAVVEDPDLRNCGDWTPKAAPATSAQPQPAKAPAWPSGCHDKDSCAGHRRCMYRKCVHEGQDIGPDIEAAVARIAGKVKGGE